MIPAPFDYVAPTRLDDVLDLLAGHRPGDVRLLAGGHALLPELKHRRARPRLVVDLDRVPELRGVDVDRTAVRLGAMTTAAEIEHHPDLAAAVPVFGAAAPVISDPMIRNRATIGGSAALADPRGDWPALLLALDAVVHLRAPGGSRDLPASGFFTPSGAGRTARRPDEVLVGITVPRCGPTRRATYRKRPHPASGWAQVGVAAVLDLDGRGHVQEARIAVSGLGIGPTRVPAAERRLWGRPTADAITEAAELVAALPLTAEPAGSVDHARALVRSYAARALTELSSWS